MGGRFKSFHLSTMTLVAIAAVVDIAYHIGGHPVGRYEITSRQGGRDSTLIYILSQLVRANLLVSFMGGAYQGYRLARERARITLGDIARAVPGAQGSARSKRMLTSDLIELVVNPVLVTLMTDIMARLDSITIDDLCRKAKEAGIVSEGRADFEPTE